MLPVTGGEPLDIVSYDAFVDDMEIEKNTFLMLLGIHAGQYHDTVKFFKDDSKKAEIDDIVRDGDQIKIPNSMAIVAPAWEILTLLDLPVFIEQRQKRVEAAMKRANTENNAEPESMTQPEAEQPSAEPADAANPNHLKDFRRLVDVAARKRPQGDQT
jgi:hypothetical protein